MRLKIREIQPSEFAAVGDLCVQAYEAGGHLEPGSPYAETIRDVSHRSTAAAVLVAERGGKSLAPSLSAHRAPLTLKFVNQVSWNFASWP